MKQKKQELLDDEWVGLELRRPQVLIQDPEAAYAKLLGSIVILPKEPDPFQFKINFRGVRQY